MIEEDPALIAGSLYGTVAALWEARSRVAELEAQLQAERKGQEPST
jgi:hypothetical protein